MCFVFLYVSETLRQCSHFYKSCSVTSTQTPVKNSGIALYLNCTRWVGVMNLKTNLIKMEYMLHTFILQEFHKLPMVSPTAEPIRRIVLQCIVKVLVFLH